MDILKSQNSVTKFYLMLLLLFGFLLPKQTIAQEENFNVLDDWIEWSNGKNMFSLFINQQSYQYLDQRQNEIDKLITQSDWETRQKKVKDTLLRLIGGLPEKTPLNSRVMGSVSKKGYTIEKIIFESMPGYYISGCLFIPDGITGKRPAILNVIGHTLHAFRTHKTDLYQPLILNLVNKGFIVFAIDPMGQGERIQYTHDEKIRVGLDTDRATSEHTYASNQCLLSGNSSGKYWIWDGIRAIDYLLSRDEVDPERIGLTGLSGGGMATAYIAAFDERIKAAAPAGYICGYRRLLESIGPQDGEQNFYHGLLNGVDHADLIEQFAPKPYLIVTTTQDFFSIQGARETYRQVNNAYTAFGKEKNLLMVEDDYKHGYTRRNRETIYQFFQNALNLTGDPAEERLDFIPAEELKVTPTGQIMTYLGGETISSLNKKATKDLLIKINRSRENIAEHLKQVSRKAKELSGYIHPRFDSSPIFRKRYQRKDYSIELYALHGEGDYVIPVMLMIPDRKGKYPAVIYLRAEGKNADAGIEGPMEVLVEDGYVVAAPDLLGTGETETSSDYPGRPGAGAALIGRSVVGIQAADIVRVIRMLQNRSDIEANKIGAVTFDELSPALLHAAAFDSSLSKTMLINPPISYKEIVNHRVYNYSLSFTWGVAGALTAYDLPDLMACIAPRSLYLINLKDNMKEVASQQLVNQEMDFPRKAYALKNTPDRLIIAESQFGEYLDIIKNWWSD